jgi:dipeptidyl aminopeptidase/acylaminoacyl peptidase
MRMMRKILTVALAAALASCADNSPPPPATSGPMLRAELASRFSDGEAPAQQILFSPDGNLVASTSAGGAVTLRRLAGGQILRRLDHPGGATSIGFDPAGRWIVTAGYDGVIRQWDMATGRLIRALADHSGTVWSLSISPDGRHIASGGEDRMLRIWRAEDGRLLRRLPGHELNIWEVRFSPDGAFVATGSFDHMARIWNVETGAVVRTLAGHQQAVVGLAYSPDGRLIATGSDDSTVRIWRAADGALLRTLPNGNHAYKVAFSPDGRWLVSAGRARSGIGTLLHDITGLGGENEVIRFWRVDDGALVAALPLGEDTSSIALSPDGRWLAVSAGTQNGLWRLPAPGAASPPP